MAITLDGTNGVTTPDLTVDTTTITVDPSNNRVGIGTASPADHLSVVASGANAHISVDRSDGATGRTVLIHSTSGGQLQTTGSVPLIFGTADTERGRFLAGGGLTFNGDTAAANALDDYEEGTWQPAVSTAAAHHSQVGIYTKIGNMVHIQCSIDFTQSGTTFGSVSGLPFVVAGVNYSSITFREWYSTGITMSGNLVIGAQSTSGFWNYVNNSASVNGQRYGYAFSTTYRT